jgi:hypothetical protein
MFLIFFFLIAGKLIKPGKVGIVEKNGRVFGIPPGRYLFPNPRASYKNSFSLQENQYHYETLTFLRVER